jgi:hypothetical protein
MPVGSKRIEDFKAGDIVLSRDEHDLDGVVSPKSVEEVFINFANVIRVHVGGQVIGTTVEHPVRAGLPRSGIIFRK